MYYTVYRNRFLGNTLGCENVTREVYRALAPVQESCGFISKFNMAKDIPVLTPVQDSYYFFPIECNLVYLIEYLDRKGYEVTLNFLGDPQDVSSSYLVLYYDRYHSYMVITHANPTVYYGVVSGHPDRIIFFPQQIVGGERRD